MEREITLINSRELFVVSSSDATFLAARAGTHDESPRVHAKGLPSAVAFYRSRRDCVRSGL
jgi:hypothetical protein